MRTWTLLLLPTLLAACPKAGTPSTPDGADTSGAAATTAGSNSPATGIAEQLTTSVTPEGLTEVKVDMNRDGKPEITNYYRERTEGRLLLRKDSDLDRDGRVDVRTEFDDGGERVKEHYDLDFDGRVDAVDHFIGGKRTFSEVDTDFNGTFDLFKYYENGVARRKERDTDADGRIDLWEYLDEQGSVVKVGRDTNGDGVMDQRDQ